MTLKDSGTRRTFTSGAQRDAAPLKGKFELVAVAGVVGHAIHMQRGAAKYNARNWELGMPLSVYFSSAMNHMFAVAQGFDDEPHLDAAIWNLNCFRETEIRIQMGVLPKELDDMPYTFKGLDYQKYVDLIRDFKSGGPDVKRKISLSKMRRKKK